MGTKRSTAFEFHRKGDEANRPFVVWRGSPRGGGGSKAMSGAVGKRGLPAGKKGCLGICANRPSQWYRLIGAIG
jgi:hypothetical protein